MLGTLLLGIVVFDAPALACSCGLGEPRDALAQADAAFVGVVTRAGAVFGDTTYRFDVEADLKGNLAEEIELDGGGSTCALAVGPGERVGLLLSEYDGHWTAGLCSQIDPDVLLLAGSAYPEPDGVGPIRYLVGGGFGAVRVLALDARGRTLAYGAGDGDVSALDACPGDRRFAEGVSTPSRGALVVLRKTTSLEILRSVRLDLNRGARVNDIECLDRAGERILAAHAGVRPSGVVLVEGRRTEIVLRQEGKAWIQDGAAYALRDAHVTCVPGPGTPCVRRAIDVPPGTSDLRWSPDGSWIAGFRYGRIRDPLDVSQVVVVEAATGRSFTFDLQRSTDSGDVAWIDDDTLAYLSSGAAHVGGHVLEIPAMTSVRRIPGGIGTSIVVGGQAVGVGGGSLTTVDLASSDPRSSPILVEASAIEVVNGVVHADPQPPPAPELASEVDANDASTGPSAFVWLGVGTVLVAFAAAFLRARRRTT